MRPPGEVRQAIDKAARELAQERSAATWRDMAERAKVGYTVARRTVENMERAGVLERVGTEKRAHSRRWMSLYAPPAPVATLSAAAPLDGATTAGRVLDLALRGWTRGY